MNKYIPLAQLMKKAEKGCPESIMLIGFNYYFGQTVNKDIPKSLQFFWTFYNLPRSHTKACLPDDYRYYSYMANVALDCLECHYVQESKQLYQRIMEESYQHLPAKECDSIIEEYRIKDHLESIDFVVPDYYAQLQFLQ